MTVDNRIAESRTLSRQVLEAIREKKGFNITILDLSDIPGASTDFFVICSGNSRTHAQAISDEVEKQMKQQQGEWPLNKEGKEHGEWILMDYVSVVVHIFQPRFREFYQLEDLWGDAPTEHFQM